MIVFVGTPVLGGHYCCVSLFVNHSFANRFPTFSGLNCNLKMSELEVASEMEVECGNKNVMASAGTVGSVSVSLHPLVIMNISEHWTRLKAQDGKVMPGIYFLSTAAISRKCL